MRGDGQRPARGIKRFRQRNKVKERSCHRCRHSDMPPAGAVIQRRRQHCQRGKAVQNSRNSEPEKRHRVSNRALPHETPVYRLPPPGHALQAAHSLHATGQLQV